MLPIKVPISPFKGVVGHKAENFPTFYLYQVSKGNEYSCTGLVCTTNLSGLINKSILPHERIYDHHVNEIVEQFKQTACQRNPVLMLTDDIDFKKKMDLFTSKAIAIKTEVNNGYTHSLSKLPEKQSEELLFSPLYVADGHHRLSALLRYYQNKGKDENQAAVMSAIFSAEKVVTRTKAIIVEEFEQNESVFWKKLEKYFDIFPLTEPTNPLDISEFRMFFKEKWYSLFLKTSFLENQQLNVLLGIEILKKFVLQQILQLPSYSDCQKVKVLFEGCNISAITSKIRGKNMIGFIISADAPNKVMEVANHGRMVEANSTYFEPKFLTDLIGFQL